MRMITHLLDGKPWDGDSTRTSPVFDPATGQQTAEVQLASAGDVDLVVASAVDAAVRWGTTSLGRRAEVMFRLRQLIDERRDEIARAISAEQGKMIPDALGEVARALENIEFACGIPHLLKGSASAEVATDLDVHEIKQPVGVVAGITPFNFPFMVPAWMASSAIACGNAFVLKPSEKDPSAGMLLAELLHEAGLPAGVCNVVNGDAEAVDRILDHPGVAAVSFVGSTPVARHVYARAAAAGKRVQALGGAKNHLVVMPDADLAAAADAAVSAAFGSAGERCMAVSVVVAVGEVGDDLVPEILRRARALRVGPATDTSADMGPLITAEHRERVASSVAAGQQEGAVVALDGTDQLRAAPGFFLGPSLLDHVTPEMSVYRNEIFGPVLCVVRVESIDDALRLIDENSYGNGAAIFTTNGAAARAFSSRVSAGMVGVNVPVPVPASFYSFGGWKSSLFGDTHIYGPESIHFYTRTKVVTSRWAAESVPGVDLSFPRLR